MEHLSINFIQEYLRNNFDIHISPMPYVMSRRYWADIQRGVEDSPDFWKSNVASFKTYENALRAGIKVAKKELLTKEQLKELKKLSEGA